MKKRRMSFFQGSANENEEPQDSATDESTGSTEPTAAEATVETEASQETVASPNVSPAAEPNADRMRTAFEGVALAVCGEVEALRNSFRELGRTFYRSMESEKAARTEAVNGVTSALGSRIDEVLAGREKTVQELKQSADQERQRVDGRLDEMKNAVEKSVNEKVEKLSERLDALDKNLNAFQLELRRQAETAERVTGLLNNMAGVFSIDKPAANPAPDAAAQPAATATEQAAEPGGRKEVDDALQRVFK